MKIVIIKLENGPKNLKAEAEIHFGREDGLLVGTKLVGFSVWDTEGGQPIVTVPSRSWGGPGERKFFDLLRNQEGPEAMRGVKAAIIDAYQGMVAAEENLPQCVLAMKCYCAGHARGNPSDAPCDTSEVPTKKRRDGRRAS